MSILIRGMEMPTSCRKCKLKMNCDNCEGWECYCLPLGEIIGYMDDEPGIPSEKRRDDCPLVPVPPHGRLIDADALEDRCSRQARDEWNKSTGTNWGYAYATFESDVEDAPTIIPADPAEEEEQIITKASPASLGIYTKEGEG